MFFVRQLVHRSLPFDGSPMKDFAEIIIDKIFVGFDNGLGFNRGIVSVGD